MKHTVEILPSILSADFGNMRSETENVIRSGAGMLHVDVMDGHFVPNLTLGPAMIEALRKTIDIPLDIHLMVEEPLPLIPAFLKAAGTPKEGSNILTIHQEACRDLNGTIRTIRELSPNTRIGVSIKPATPVSVLEDLTEPVDVVLLMTVEPGFGGQGLIESCLEKIGEVRNLFETKGYPVLIELDGGIKLSNLDRVMEADLLVMGSAIFKAGDEEETRERMRAVLQKAEELSQL